MPGEEVLPAVYRDVVKALPSGSENTPDKSIVSDVSVNFTF